MKSPAPRALGALILFSQLSVALWVLTLTVDTFVPVSVPHRMDTYTGRFVFVPFFWIAGMRWWQDGTRGERASIVRMARSMLWLAMGLGVIDLIMGSLPAPWSLDGRISPWSLLGYWALPMIWLLALRRRAVSRWVEGSAEPSPQPLAPTVNLG